MSEEGFQTPEHVCNYMAGFLPGDKLSVLEPTPGKGNLVRALQRRNAVVTSPLDFFEIDFSDRYDWVVMNPPFSPMKVGYEILEICMGMPNNVIALMPWLVLINSVKRTDGLYKYGLRSVTHLPRTVFKGARVQCCILELRRGFEGETTLINYQLLRKR